MKWEFMFYGGEYYGKIFVVEVENVEEVRRIVF